MARNPFEQQAELQTAPLKQRVRKQRNEGQAPCRQGKVGMGTFVDQDVHRTFKELCLSEERSLDSFMIEGLNLVLVKYGRKPIA